MIGKTVKVIVDRPLGSCHPRYKDMIYLVNYGYVEGVIAPDGEEQDVYILGVVAPENITFTAEQIAEKVRFQEQYFNYEIIM